MEHPRRNYGGSFKFTKYQPDIPGIPSTNLSWEKANHPQMNGILDTKWASENQL